MTNKVNLWGRKLFVAILFSVVALITSSCEGYPEGYGSPVISTSSLLDAYEMAIARIKSNPELNLGDFEKTCIFVNFHNKASYIGAIYYLVGIQTYKPLNNFGDRADFFINQNVTNKDCVMARYILFEVKYGDIAVADGLDMLKDLLQRVRVEMRV
jgi:hypothetical protein